MNLDEIKSRLMKMKAVANASVGGERANAEKLLVELARKYGHLHVAGHRAHKSSSAT